MSHEITQPGDFTGDPDRRGMFLAQIETAVSAGADPISLCRLADAEVMKVLFELAEGHLEEQAIHSLLREYSMFQCTLLGIDSDRLLGVYSRRPQPLRRRNDIYGEGYVWTAERRAQSMANFVEALRIDAVHPRRIWTAANFQLVCMIEDLAAERNELGLYEHIVTAYLRIQAYLGSL